MVKLVCAPNVLTFREEQPLVRDGAIVVDDEADPPRVLEVGHAVAMREKYPNATEERYEGHAILPGLVNMHTHFYSALARGISLSGAPPSNFMETLRRLWWRLDRVLDHEGVRSSAAVGLLDGVRQGITTFFDHHASFSAIDGSLDEIAAMVRQLGVRASLCYEVSDRQGALAAEAAVRENDRFAGVAASEEMLAAMMGIHAQFTVNDDTLRACVEAERKHDCGFHVHIAEDEADQVLCQSEHKGQRVVERLREHGVVKERGEQVSILAHGVYLSDAERQLLHDSNCVIAHNPESNLNNAVGVTDVHKLMTVNGIQVGAGSDGFCSGIWHSVRLAYLLPKHLQRPANGADVRANPGAMFAETMRILQTNANVASNVFRHKRGALRVGELGPNSVADWIVVPYAAPTPTDETSEASALMHLMFGLMDRTPVHVFCAGRAILRDGQFVTVDERRLTDWSRDVAERLWRTFLEGVRTSVPRQLTRAVTAADLKKQLQQSKLPESCAALFQDERWADAAEWAVRLLHNGNCRSLEAVPRTAPEVRDRLSSDAQRLLHEMTVGAVEAYRVHSNLAGYRRTRLVRCDRAAQAAGVSRIWVKDESKRWGLPSFKLLGSSFAVQREMDRRGCETAKALTLTTATDGNHGRAVAWCARRYGAKCEIFVPKGLAAARIAAIEAEGAHVVVMEGDYDEAVDTARREGERNENWVLISDTGAEPGEPVPRDVMTGYCTIFREAVQQMPRGHWPTHVFVQAGIGGLACAACAFFLSDPQEGRPLPRLVIVEPTRADGLLATCERDMTGQGRPDGAMPLDSMMQGLNSAVPSATAWPLLKEAADAFLAVGDAWAAASMRVLFHERDPVPAGESGAASFAGVLACTLGDERFRSELGLDENSIVLAVNSEAVTDPVNYVSIVPEAKGKEGALAGSDDDNSNSDDDDSDEDDDIARPRVRTNHFKAALVQSIAPTGGILPDTIDELDKVTPEMLIRLRTACIEKNVQIGHAAADEGAAIVCFGELSSAPYFATERRDVWWELAESAEDGPTVKAMRRLARDRHMIVVVPLYEQDSETGKRFNTAVFIDEYGRILGKYRKNHIPSGRNEKGEFYEDYYYERGAGVDLSKYPANVSQNKWYPVYRTSLGRIGVATCYDRHFEGVMSSLATNGAQLIFSPAVSFGADSERMWPMEFAVDAMRNNCVIGGINRYGSEVPWRQEYYGNSYFCTPSSSRLRNIAKHPDLVISEIELDDHGWGSHAHLEKTSSGWNILRDRVQGSYF